MAPRTATQVAAKWAQRMGQATTAYKEGIAAVTTPPGQQAARAATLWATNVAASKAKYSRNVAAVSLTDWQNAASTKGGQRLAAGATAAQPKFQATMATLLPYIDRGVGQLPARGNLEANIARSAAWQRYMAAYQKPAGS